MRISIGDRLLLNTYVDLFKRQGEWTLFFNVSFRKAASYEWAKKRFKWFLKYLNTKERSFYANFVRCLVFYERHDTTSGSIHIHALIDRISPWDATAVNTRARKYFGEWSDVRAYDSARKGVEYFARKIGSSKLVEYEFYVINSKVRTVETRETS